MSPKKVPATERIGGPGASHENRKQPEKSKPRGPHPSAGKPEYRSKISGGGGESDTHHTHDPWEKGKG